MGRSACILCWILLLCNKRDVGVFADDSFFSLNPFLKLYGPSESLSPQCHNAVISFQNATMKRAPWALQMLDASSKIPSGLLFGNVVDLGNYDECLAIRSDGFTDHGHSLGKYCLISATFNKTSKDDREHPLTLKDLTGEWTWSVCVPAACSESDVRKQLELSLQNIAGRIQNVYCMGLLGTAGLPVASWFMIYFTSGYVAFILMATWMELKSIKIPHQPTNSVILSFSLIRNGEALLKTTPPGLMLDSIQGIRVLSTLAVFFYHQAVFYNYAANINHSEVFHKLTHNVLGVTQLNGVLAVDCFFLMGGTVLAFGFLRERKAHIQFSYFKHALYRYLRITPVYFYVILIDMTVFYDIGSGPFWNTFAAGLKESCRNYWWANVLYINDYYNGGGACLGYTWYLGADMKFYLVAPLFLFALLKDRRCGIILIIFTCLASCAYIFSMTYIHDYPWTLTINVDYRDAEKGHYQNDIYLPAHARLSPYMIGLLLGYLLNRHKEEKIEMSYWTRAFGWTIAIIVLVSIPYGLAYYYWFGSGPLLSALYSSLHRPLFVLAISWIIFVSDQGYGGPINAFLSSKPFQILSRLSFSFYLIHSFCMEYDYGTKRTAGYFSYYNMLQASIFHIIILLPFAAVLSLTLEYPIIHLSKLLLTKKRAEIPNSTHPIDDSNKVQVEETGPLQTSTK
ncbi:unnamed protein product [Bemisia tabaci]|uniref:Nose resistant-to-fluoxetine protein N-terminal domain-containing protein n=1 Tax=Bemisia tabaci TaxID=7038 RepID=A0A9P0AJM0_BEMTA|nr:unnamed protein product [Bemisia tabaci]